MLDRLISALEIKGLTGVGGQASIAAATGYSAATVSTVFNKKSKLTNKFLRSVCSAYGINEEWVRTGEGEMFMKKILDFNDSEGIVDSLKLGNGGFTNFVDPIRKDAYDWIDRMSDDEVVDFVTERMKKAISDKQK